MIHQVDHRWPGQPLEIMEIHSDRVAVAAGVELNAPVLLQLSVALRRNAEEDSKRRHGPKLAGWKCVREFSLGGEPHVFRPRDEFQVLQVNALIRRYDGKQQRSVGLYDHGFRQFLAGYVQRLGNPLGGICGWVSMMLKFHTVLSEVLRESC
jgi:hypothetical protein